MPELPEVENVRRALLPLIKDQQILAIEVLKKRIIQGDVEQFKAVLIGNTFRDITRHGKYLFFHFDQNIVVISHLRMEGKYIVLEQDEPLSKYARVIFTLANGQRLVYDDSRQFGLMILSDEKSYRHVKEIRKLGPEPFDADPQKIFQELQKTSRPIKTVLLDQTILTGLGNIYVDEVLFRNQIHPLTRANLLSLNAVEQLLKTSCEVLKLAIQYGGSTVRTYQISKDHHGEFQNFLKAYGKAGSKCRNCGHRFKKIKVGGRGTTYCPFEQINPEAPLVIGITGPIGSGKSTLAKGLAEHGFTTVSSDQIVHQLYEEDDVKKQLRFVFGDEIFNDDGDIVRAKLATLLTLEPKKKKDLERFIHPLVRQKIEGIIKETPAKTLLFVEVPLLFEARYEDLFQFIVGVMTTPEKQLNYLETRGDNLDFARKMIATSRFYRYVEQLDLLLLNDGTKKDLLIKMETFINPILKQLQAIN